MQIGLLRTLLAAATLLSPVAGIAQDMDWPIDNANRTIWHSYGQYQKFTTSSVSYLHEGIDVTAAPGTDVCFHLTGQVSRVEWNPAFPNSGYVEIQNGQRIWEYRHVWPSVQQGQQIQGTTVIGTIADLAAGNMTSHLHLNVVVNGIYDDPLLHLVDRNRRPKPPKPDEYRYQRSDGSRFYQSRTCKNRPVIKEGTDIIVKAEDGFLNVGQSDIAVHSLRFGVKRGRSWMISERSFRFGNGSRDIRMPRNTNGVALVPVFYSQVAPVKSVDTDTGAQGSAVLATDDHDFYYYLTNIGLDRRVIAPADKDRYWNTKVENLAGRRWNTRGNEATENRSAKYYDWTYKIVTVSQDERGKDSRPLREYVFVNNFDEVLGTSDEEGRVQEKFAIGEAVYLIGSGYPPNKRFTIYSVGGQISDCMDLGAVALTVTTDAAGSIPPTLLGTAEQNAFSLVLDYDYDRKYTSPREGHVVDTTLVVPAGN